MLRLPDDLRGAFKDPFGPVFTDAETLLSAAAADAERHGYDPGSDAPVVAVGDVVTYHLREAGRNPDVAVVDGRTEREAVAEEVREVAVGSGEARHVENPPATLAADLLRALRDAVESDDPVTIVVDGEEDLATLPAILVVPDGAAVVYGQPGEGMVHVAVTPTQRAEVRELFSRLDGDVASALELLGVSSCE